MEITDVTPGKRSQAGAQATNTKAVQPANSASDAAASVTTHASNTQTFDGSAIALSKANSAISALNVAQGATSDITQLVKSIGGIVDQASKPDVPANRLSALQTEANQLVQAIKSKANVSLPDSSKPLAGDPITLDAQSEIGQTVRVSLPSDATQAFGIKNIDFSASDNVKSAQSQVANARQKLATLKKSVDDSTSAVRQAVSKIDVAFQNSESSKSTVRDVGNAVALAQTSRKSIRSNHLDALSAHDSLNSSFKELLE